MYLNVQIVSKNLNEAIHSLEDLDQTLEKIKQGRVAAPRELKTVGEEIAAQDWYNAVNTHFISRSGQLARGMTVKPVGWSLRFRLKALQHTCHTTLYGNGEMTWEYNKFVKGIAPSLSGRYDPCVGSKVWVKRADPRTGMVGYHPGVPREKYWMPTIRQFLKTAIPKYQRVALKGIRKFIFQKRYRGLRARPSTRLGLV